MQQKERYSNFGTTIHILAAAYNMWRIYIRPRVYNYIRWGNFTACKPFDRTVMRKNWTNVDVIRRGILLHLDDGVLSLGRIDAFVKLLCGARTSLSLRIRQSRRNFVELFFFTITIYSNV